MAVIRLKRQAKLTYLCLVLSVLVNQYTQAAVLPADRADALYHYYDGGGVDVQGPSILVRKSIKDKVSVSVNYYVDNISSASIDVVTTASPYTEERVETSVGIDYLHDKTIMSLNYTKSDESDFSARSAHFSVSQDFFGDLTTLTIGYSQGWDEIGKTGDPSFNEEATRRNFRLGLSQVITKNSIINIGWETITDQGYLNNPYRLARVEDLTDGEREYSYLPEIYPETRTSDAFALRGMYYLPYRAALKFEYKLFADTWGIEATTTEIAYTHPYGDNWIFDLKFRFYQQGQAHFYRDIYREILTVDGREVYARDKELSKFSSNSFGFGVSYQNNLSDWQYFDKYSIHLKIDHFLFDYDNFNNLLARADDESYLTAGTEPTYSFEANVIRFYLSVYY